MLHERVNYLDRSVQYLVAQDIIEYDLQEAGYNVIKQFKLLSDYDIGRLSEMDKRSKHIEIGMQQRRNKDFRYEFKETMASVRKLFMEENGIKSDDILSIKNDAIYTLKRARNTEFGYLKFVPTYYTSYYYFDRYEFYYNGQTITVKGIGDEEISYHGEYMMDVLRMYMMYNERDMFKENKYMVKEFLHYYKTRSLDLGYYRELNRNSMFRLNTSIHGDSVISESIEDVNMVDIAYNFNRYIVPMIQILA